MDQSARPTGLVAFLFTDVVGSTRLWAADSEAMATDLQLHDRLLRSAIAANDGYAFYTAGDSFGAAFASAGSAVTAAIDAQRDLAAQAWASGGGLTVRMGIHTGEAHERDGDYYGTPVNLCARLMSAAHGGQVLISATAAESAAASETIDLGMIQLRDIDEPVSVRQVAAPDLARTFPALTGADTERSTLPQFRSSFIGRRAEVDRIRRLLAGSRLVTVTGVGGAGKTRTVVEAASRELGQFDGVYFVDLARVTDDDAVPGAFAGDIQLSVDRDPMTRLVTYLSDRTVLLVVDNCEHLLDPVAETLDHLMQTCPKLSVLATSREAIEIEGEETYRLPSLDIAEEAVRLFVERATAADDRFELSAGNRAAIVEICERLDGMPLAIELAASRIRALGLNELLAGLDDRFSLLRAGRRRGVLQRQRTLEAAIEWSYDLLTPEEQRFFRSLGAFSGPFLFELVPGTCGVNRAEALDLLDSLVAKSLIATSRFEDGSTSYRLLETLRSFAIDRLAAEGETRDAAEHLYETIVAQRSDDGIIPEAEQLIRFRHHISDIFAAFDHAIEQGDARSAARIICGANIVLVGTPEAVALFERVNLLREDWFDHLDVDLQAQVEGEWAINAMGAGDYGPAMETASRGLQATHGARLESQLQLHLTQVLIAGTVDPRAGLHVVTELEEAHEREQVATSIRQILESATMGIYALNGQYDRLRRRLAQPHPGAGYHMREAWAGWLEHVLGEPTPHAPATGLVPDGTWNFAAHIGRCMGADTSLDDKARELAEISDRFRLGRLRFEDSEYLTAFARVAFLRGDHDRALALGNVIVNRTPWSGWALAHTYGAIEGWPADEWLDRHGAFTRARFDLEYLANATERAPQLLEEELNRSR